PRFPLRLRSPLGLAPSRLTRAAFLGVLPVRLLRSALLRQPTQLRLAGLAKALGARLGFPFPAPALLEQVAPLLFEELLAPLGLLPASVGDFPLRGRSPSLLLSLAFGTLRSRHATALFPGLGAPRRGGSLAAHRCKALGAPLARALLGRPRLGFFTRRLSSSL